VYEVPWRFRGKAKLGGRKKKEKRPRKGIEAKMLSIHPRSTAWAEERDRRAFHSMISIEPAGARDGKKKKKAQKEASRQKKSERNMRVFHFFSKKEW